MKSLYRILLLAIVVITVACAPRERTLILLSTNDIHAKIQNFPALAAAVKACRDTAELVVLVDAGDRWTGNAYVDRAAMPGLPILQLMNELGYDVATLGNHEFDHGQAFLGRALDSMAFEVVCANVVSDTASFPQLPPYVVLKRDGIRIGFVGVITNYEGAKYPAGRASSFEGLQFPDPQQMAEKYAAELRPKCDVLVLLSHMGDNRDEELLTRNTQYDVVIGGHTHERINKRIGKTLLTQTGKELKNVGVTVIKLRGKRVESTDFHIVSLSDYQPDADYQSRVNSYYADPELNRPVGEFSAAADKWGLVNWMAGTVADKADAEVGLYHIGGVRLDGIPAGGVSTARLFDLEPFGTQIAVTKMTSADLRRAIISKYNDPVNTKEAHRIDMVSTIPYVIVTDAKDNAIDVKFTSLSEGRSYTVAMSDYIFNNYNDLNYTDGKITDAVVYGALLEELREESPLSPDNKARQEVLKRK